MVNDTELTENQKIQLSHEAFVAFIDQFGENDIVKEAFLDILLEAIYGKKTEETTNGVPVSCETRQNRNEDIKYIGAGGMPTYTIE